MFDDTIRGWNSQRPMEIFVQVKEIKLCWDYTWFFFGDLYMGCQQREIVLKWKCWGWWLAPTPWAQSMPERIILSSVSLQSDREKQEGLPVAPFMDRDKVTKPTAQIGFIKFVLIPMFETVAKVREALSIKYMPYRAKLVYLIVANIPCEQRNLWTPSLLIGWYESHEPHQETNECFCSGAFIYRFNWVYWGWNAISNLASLIFIGYC